MTNIFVFGSNLAGRHGKGAAWTAKQAFGAIQGQGEGLQGNSYAIPTKGHDLELLPKRVIKGHVDTFLTYAFEHPELTFMLTAIGCGLARNKPEDIAPMFEDAPRNVILPEVFIKVLAKSDS